MTDSAKIALQILLDVKSFGQEVMLVCEVTDPLLLPPFKLMMDNVTDAQKAIGAT